jgi:hypothetical protein
MIAMAETITVNVEKEVASEFRRYAAMRYGTKKGHLGKALNEAMVEWSKNREADVVNEALKLLKKGIKMKKWKFNREELYER